MADEREVDEPVEDQTTAAEAALTVVLADLVMSQGDQSEDDSAFWVPLLLGGPRLVLNQFLLVSTALMWPTTPPPVVRRAVETSSDVAMRRAADIIAQGVPEMREVDQTNRTARIVSTSGRASRAAVVGGREAARFDVAKTEGAVYKVWRTRRDKRVRPTHGGLEGNSIPLSSEFITYEGNALRFPRDPIAPLEETAECRCRLAYRIKDL